MASPQRKFRRSDFLKAGLAVAALPSAVALAGSTPRAGAVPLTPTPQCDDGDDPTPPQTEGPYFTPGSPERTSLVEPGMPGTPLVLGGVVYNLACQPLSDVLLDFWQANDAGEYDNEGYRLRGHQFTKADGHFELSTIVAGLYTGRTRHIHVKVQAPNKPIRTTQLYFPDEPTNDSDPLFDPALLMAIDKQPDGQRATFDFVLDLS